MLGMNGYETRLLVEANLGTIASNGSEAEVRTTSRNGTANDYDVTLGTNTIAGAIVLSP